MRVGGEGVSGGDRRGEEGSGGSKGWGGGDRRTPSMNTVEPPNNGHIGKGPVIFVHHREVSTLRRLEMYSVRKSTFGTPKLACPLFLTMMSRNLIKLIFTKPC